MFDFSFAELLLVVVVAVVFIGPKELPVVVRTLAKAMRALRSLSRQAVAMFDDLAKESGIKETTQEINREIRMIQGDDGKMYEAYDLPTPVIEQKKSGD